MRALARWTMLRIRLYRLDRNPLRRRSDRIEGLAVLVLLLLFAGVLAAAPMIGSMIYQQRVASERSGHWVTARLLSNAPTMTWTSLEGQAIDLSTRVTWITPTGQRMTGEAPVARGLKAGATIRVWLTASGRPAANAPSRSETVAQAIGCAIAVVLFSTALLAGCFAGVRGLLNRRRHNNWGVEWISAAGQWQRREEA